jgi:hypothetical protein
MIRGTLLEPLAWFAYSAIAVTGLCGILYVCVQQSFRQNLNDPQIALAEDAARTLVGGGVPAQVVPRGNLIDLRDSLTPWVAVYDSSGKALEASGFLNNAPPTLPKGVFDDSTWLLTKTYSAQAGKETRFTWAAAPDVRQAVVLIKLSKPSSGAMYVAVGRNMREIEDRIIHVGSLVFMAWTVILGVLLVASYIGWWLLKPVI